MSSNKTIVKNSLFLYFRMFLTMGVGLYSSRLVLQELGVVDYGIYGLVGGIVAMFGFFNAAMSSATQRYLSFDLGKEDYSKLQKTFSVTLTIHICIAFLVFVLAETIGVWYINNKMVFPLERETAIHIVYQFSVFTTLLGIIQVPYNALIIARERMNIYAYISIVEAILKLSIVFLLVYLSYDKLITYAVLTFVVALCIRLFYQYYCIKNYQESKYIFKWDKPYFKELVSFSGWSLFGNIAAVARSQGSNILLNLFFGPIANAAYGLTLMVQGVVGNFVSNFQIALNPQITKSYAKGEYDRLRSLMFKSSKFSFFAMFLIVIPIIYNIDFLLKIWLVEIPKYTTGFVILALCYSLIETISNPLMVSIQATGNIKWYQIIVGGFIFLTLPITWIVFQLTSDPYYVYWVLIINSVFSLFIRIFFLKKQVGINISHFFKQVLGPILLISGIVFLLFFYKIDLNFFNLNNNFVKFAYMLLVIMVVNIVLILTIGISKTERNYLKVLIKSKFTKYYEKN